jgi:hypothetical protein
MTASGQKRRLPAPRDMSASAPRIEKAAASANGTDLISEFPKFCLPPDPNQSYIFAIPSHSEGRFAIVTDAGSGCGGRK